MLPVSANTTHAAAATPAAHQVVMRAAARSPTRSAAPTALPTSASAAKASPSRKNAAKVTNCISTAFAARIVSPCLALWAMNQAKATISAAERIMMSRLTAIVRRMRSAGPQLREVPAAAEPAQVPCSDREPDSGRHHLGQQRPQGDALHTQPEPEHEQRIEAMLVTLSTSCRASAMRARPRPMNQPSSA